LPDVLFCLASGSLMLAAILLVSSFTNDELTAGNAGTELAQLFSGALIGAGVFVFLVGLLLLHDGRGRADHYVTPILLGVIAGAVEAVLVLQPAGFWIAAPLLVLILALRPVRRWLARMTGQRQPATRRP
jgi:MFS family permease